jgi:hypothetical protein
MRLGHLIRPHYANILLLSNTGEKLSTIGGKRADWYVEKNLAVELPPFEGYSRVLQLKFTPKNNLGNEFSLLVKHNQCVICGSPSELSLHHVIPYCIKRHFPSEKKEHTSEWCVLCCETCHIKAELPVRMLYKSLQDNLAQAFNNHPNVIFNHTLYRLFKLKKIGGAEYVEPEKLISWLASVSLNSLDQIPTDYPELEKLFLDRSESREETKRTKRTLVLEFIEQNGGIDGVKRIFRESFLAMKPQFLPKGFLEI